MVDDTPQAELFAPTGPVMLCALLRQSQARVAKLQPYLLAEQSLALYTECSLFALMLDKVEGAVLRSQVFRDAQLAPIVVPIDKAASVIAGQILPGIDGRTRWSLKGRRWRKPNTPSTPPR